MKRIIAFVLATTLLIFSSICVIAENNDGYTYYIEDYSITFSNDTAFSEEQRELIAYYLVYGDDDIELYNILCSLFGHNTITETVTLVQHEYYANAPRCLEQLIEVTKCSRCDEIISTTVLSSRMIYCCP